MSPKPDYRAFFSAQIAALGADAQHRLQRASVAVVGCGGVGSAATMALAQAGVGRITVIDGQRISPDNLNRLPFARRGDIGNASRRTGESD